MWGHVLLIAVVCQDLKNFLHFLEVLLISTHSLTVHSASVDPKSTTIAVNPGMTPVGYGIAMRGSTFNTDHPIQRAYLCEC